MDRLCPLRTVSAWNLSLSAQRLRPAACANSHSRRRTHALPLRIRPPCACLDSAVARTHTHPRPTLSAAKHAHVRADLHQQHGRTHQVNAGQGLQQSQRNTVASVSQGAQQLASKRRAVSSFDVRHDLSQTESMCWCTLRPAQLKMSSGCTQTIAGQSSTGTLLPAISL